MHALRLALLDEVLPRELERRLHRLRTAGSEVHLVERLRYAVDQRIGERLHRLVAEERGVSEGQGCELPPDRVDHCTIGVPETGHRAAPRSVDVAPPFAITQINTLPNHPPQLPTHCFP